MVEKRGRLGRKNGKGFYDYPQSGPKRLWPGLAELQAKKLDPDSIDVEEIKHRLLGGLDDIALSLRQAEAIDAYEGQRERSGPVTTAL